MCTQAKEGYSKGSNTVRFDCPKPPDILQSTAFGSSVRQCLPLTRKNWLEVIGWVRKSTSFDVRVECVHRCLTCPYQLYSSMAANTCGIKRWPEKKDKQTFKKAHTMLSLEPLPSKTAACCSSSDRTTLRFPLQESDVVRVFFGRRWGARGDKGLGGAV